MELTMKYLPRIKLFFQNALGPLSGAFINERADMENVPGWDSQSFLTLLLAMEDEFLITVSTLDAASLYSVKAINDYLERRLG
jgi:acyl carrier protein